MNVSFTFLWTVNMTNNFLIFCYVGWHLFFRRVLAALSSEEDLPFLPSSICRTCRFLYNYIYPEKPNTRPPGLQKIVQCCCECSWRVPTNRSTHCYYYVRSPPYFPLSYTACTPGKGSVYGAWEVAEVGVLEVQCALVHLKTRTQSRVCPIVIHLMTQRKIPFN